MKKGLALQLGVTYTSETARLDENNNGKICIGNYFEAVFPRNDIPDPPPVTEGGEGEGEPNTVNLLPQGDISYYYSGSQRIAMRTGQGAYLLFSDHLGSTSVVMDASGQVVEEGYYMPWGGERGDQGISTTDYGYTGQMKEGDIYYYGARWYDPVIGRFMQADTIVPADIQGTQAFDRYAYVNNNPLRYTDPSGKRACDDYYGKGCDVIKPPLPWYEVDGVYSFSGSWFMGPPLVGPIPISQETNVYDPVVTGNLPIHNIGSVLDILNSQLGMHIPIIENEVDKNIFWEMTVSVNDKKLNIDSFWIYDGIMGYRKYLTVDIVAHYGIADGTRSKRVETIIEDFDPDSIKYCPYRLYFPDGIYFDKPQRLELSMEILCGSCLNGRPKWQGFYQRIR
jgi:RHS repeat-associated protein